AVPDGRAQGQDGLRRLRAQSQERPLQHESAGVQSVEINRKQYKVTVQGFVEPHKVVKRVQTTGKKAEIWPYIPYNLVAHPYAAQTYDKKAPPGYVRKVDAVMPVASYGGPGAGAQEERLTTMFSDDNPNACSVM
uniref:HMA domain-containing protein n=1 Tax=Aegilops tauschii subsp. strangulata TaxID=200361 RepID=A0A453KPZ5_AEGTS